MKILEVIVNQHMNRMLLARKGIGFIISCTTAKPILVVENIYFCRGPYIFGPVRVIAVQTACIIEVILLRTISVDIVNSSICCSTLR